MLQTNSLKSQLTQFGLNPRDWMIIPVAQKDHEFELRHIEIPEVKMKGFTNIKQSSQKRDFNPAWQKLEFISL